jgi:hypothetical protein
MTPIKEMSAEDRMRRALLVIEGLATDMNDVDSYSLLKSLRKIVGDVYAIAHAASGLCCTGGSFDQFYKVQEDAEKFLKDANIVDVAEAMKRKPKY